MRKVTRPDEPLSLRTHKAEWTRDLLDALERSKVAGERVSNSLKSRYNQDDVREALCRMYDNLCCYCESSVRDVAWEHIEHYKPKSLFPELTFEWTNLHLACPKCNVAKGDQWEDDHPILDPTEPLAFEEHVSFKEPEAAAEGVVQVALSDRGRTTIKHAALNRDTLCEARLDVYLHSLVLAHKLAREREHPNAELAREQAFKTCTKCRLASMVWWVLVDVVGIRP
jgi:5-methylcytosine-specific restriction endonuclease McrA